MPFTIGLDPDQYKNGIVKIKLQIFLLYKFIAPMLRGFLIVRLLPKGKNFHETI